MGITGCALVAPCYALDARPMQPQRRQPIQVSMELSLGMTRYKISVSVVTLCRHKRLPNLSTHVVAARPNRGSKPGQHVSRGLGHCRQGGFYDTGSETPPAGVDGSHLTAICCGQHDGQAVGRHYRAARTGPIGPDGIGLGRYASSHPIS